MVPCCKVKVLEDIDDGVIASLKVAVTLALIGTNAAELRGAVELMVGGMMSAGRELLVPPHPATKPIRRSATDHSIGLVIFAIPFIFQIS
jgi:hypothetical protein